MKEQDIYTLAPVIHWSRMSHWGEGDNSIFKQVSERLRNFWRQRSHRRQETVVEVKSYQGHATATGYIKIDLCYGRNREGGNEKVI